MSMVPCLSAVEWVELLEDYGCVRETLSSATRLDGRLRSDHAFNCPFMAHACVRGQYAVS